MKSSLDTFVMEDMVRDNIAWMIRVEERLLKDSAMAEDAVQEAFVSAFRGFDSFQNHSTLITATGVPEFREVAWRACSAPDAKLPDEVPEDLIKAILKERDH
ncbi:sigma factor [Bathymodiolus japonicus methanotrophic gill symbiont]|uniref:sigma factor n=1 Tax=Bathymodiolus japonicus methanotrophic gill symbiont TaxID=113269 RepID=UPI001C8D70BC|nr:sigma factor [Bathymodiolus japonicus methanotrophic gill symbiont]